MKATDNQLLHPKTRAEVARFLANPFHFLLIEGPSGSGKLSLAKSIAAALLSLDSGKLEGYRYLIHLRKDPDKQQIPVEAVRQARHKLNLKTTGSQPIRRLVLIEDSHNLSEEAQNTLLKTLEEPPVDTVIILTVDSTNNLLPTIVSRSQIVSVNPVSQDQAANFFGSHFSAEDIKRNWLLSEGSVGLMTALLRSDRDHEMHQAIVDAKEFIRLNKYQRLLLFDRYTKGRQELGQLLTGLGKVIKAAQKIAITGGRKANGLNAIKSRKLVNELSQALEANVSPRLVYLRLCLLLDL